MISLGIAFLELGIYYLITIIAAVISTILTSDRSQLIPSLIAVLIALLLISVTRIIFSSIQRSHFESLKEMIRRELLGDVASAQSTDPFEVAAADEDERRRASSPPLPPRCPSTDTAEGSSSTTQKDKNKTDVIRGVLMSAEEKELQSSVHEMLKDYSSAQAFLPHPQVVSRQASCLPTPAMSRACSPTLPPKGGQKGGVLNRVRTDSNSSCSPKLPPAHQRSSHKQGIHASPVLDPLSKNTSFAGDGSPVVQNLSNLSVPPASRTISQVSSPDFKPSKLRLGSAVESNKYSSPPFSFHSPHSVGSGVVGSPRLSRNVHSQAGSFQPSVWDTVERSSKQEGTVLHLRLKLSDILDESQAEDAILSVLERLSSVIGKVLAILMQYEAVIHFFDLSDIIATFNVHRPCPEHCHRAVFASLAIAYEIEPMLLSCPWGIGIAQGLFLAGHTGTRELRAYVVFGTSMTVSEDLAELNFTLGTRILIEESIHDIVNPEVFAILVDYIQHPLTNNVTGIFELRGDNEVDRYFFDQQRVTQYLEGLMALTQGNLESSLACFKKLTAVPPSDGQAMRLYHLAALFAKKPGAFTVPYYRRQNPRWINWESDAEAFLATTNMRSSPAPQRPSNDLDFSAFDQEIAKKEKQRPQPLSDSGSERDLRRQTSISHSQTRFEGTHVDDVFRSNSKAKKTTSPGQIFDAITRAQSSAREASMLSTEFLSEGGLISPIPMEMGTLAAPMSLDTVRTFLDTSGVQWKQSLKMLGRGTFGEVYLGMRSVDGKLVAMKILPVVDPDAAPMSPVRRKPGVVDPLQQKIDLLKSEISMLIELRHENIVSFLGCGVDHMEAILIMEYVSGGSLSSMIKEFGTIPLQATQRYIKDTLRGLSYLHRKGVIHRDVKHENVLLHVNGRCKVTDFGSTMKINLFTENKVVGTPIFMAPEQAKGPKHTVPASDLWSVGIMTIHLLTGKLPYPTDKLGTEHALLFQLAFNEKFNPEIPESIHPLAKDFVVKCLQRDPIQRGTADELLMHPFLVTRLEDPTLGGITREFSMCGSSPDFGNSYETNLSAPGSLNTTQQFSGGSFKSRKQHEKEGSQ